MKIKCKHENTKAGPDYCYSGSVAVEPYTHENRAAHGGVSYEETCLDCGAVRSVNTNRWHKEVSPWNRRGRT